MEKEQEKEKEKVPPRPAEEVAPRDDVAVNRCPFCHEAVRVDDAWVACARCLARHHPACFGEGGRCGACAHEATLVAPARSQDTSWRRAALLASIGLFVAGLVIWLAALGERRAPPTAERERQQEAREAALVPVPFVRDHEWPRPDASGDLIEVDEVLATSLSPEEGSQVVARGRYVLRRHPRATLGFYASNTGVDEPQNHRLVDVGEGRFELRTTIGEDGRLNVKLYGPDGAPIVGVHFHIVPPG